MSFSYFNVLFIVFSHRMASHCLTVTKAQDFPDIEIKCSEKVTLGENARKKKEDKKKREREREYILQGICALLNSGGGVLTLDIDNSYNYRRDGRGLDIEQHLKELVGSPIEDMIEFVHQDDKVSIYVSGHPANHRPRLCSINTGLWERAGSNDERVSPKEMSEFLRKRKDRAKRNQQENGCPPAKRHAPLAGSEIIKQRAEEFYNRDSVEADKCLEFGESVHVELKQFDNSENLPKRLKEVVPKNISAFGNTDGGFMFIGINDKSQEVIGCGKGVNAEVLQSMVEDVCRKSKLKAIHTSDCKKNTSWSPECRLIKVITPKFSEADGYVVAIKIPVFCCAVFGENPNSWHIEGSTVCRLEAPVWMKKMQLSDPDEDLCERFQNVLSLRDAPPQCKPVYSIESLTHLQEKLFPVPENNIEVVPDGFKNKALTDAILSANSAKSPGICICSQSWAVDIDLPKNKDVISEALIISTDSYPTLCCVVETESPDLWKYATNTAFHLKQKLINLGGYTGKLCVIPQLVETKNDGSITVKNHQPSGPLLYPNSYRLDQEQDVRALLHSLVIVVMTFTSPLSDDVGCEFLNLLTEEQFKIFQTHGGIKNLFIHGVPESGKTLIAMELMRRIKNIKQNLCQCETRFKFMDEHMDFSVVKHIIVDEAQNFCVKKGEINWYEKAQKLIGEESLFWVFLDYHQKVHVYPDGLPLISKQSKTSLCKVVRNSAKVLKVMQDQMKMITDSPSSMTAHLAKIQKKMKPSHSFQGDFKIKKAAPGKEVDLVLQILQHLLSQGHTAGHVAVLFSTKEELDAERDKLMTGFPILFSSVEEINPNKMVLDTVRRFAGLERNIVILVNPSIHPRFALLEPNFLLCAYSRARIRLYVVKSS
ncbi:schlafen family member 13-like isoform X2 [Alosa pseudoharengus]|uniref:schlafen family member 13-like isoform X2 n=1 Tax=Alosa pseudoharengus TaxID=34774 RepID=UPI003F8A6E96